MSSRNFQKPIRIKGKKLVLTKKMIEDAQSQTKSNMAAARWLSVSYLTYRKYAKIYGLFDGLIDENIKINDNVDILSDKLKNNLKEQENNGNKYLNLINEINDLKLIELKNKCKELGLKRSGSKYELIESILEKLLDYNKLLE